MIKKVEAAPSIEEAEEKMPVRMIQGLGIVAPYILIVWVILSIVLIPYHPLDHFPSKMSPYVKDHHVVATRILIHKAEKGVWIYQIFNGELPPSLDDLSAQGILQTRDLLD
ncbi:MAG: hypothetical protein N2445_04855, partial [Acidobacteria bacterium]|nr:hypothetical protein [Acidobacteriota bacterium]